jgi:uncharacterized protein YceK
MFLLHVWQPSFLNVKNLVISHERVKEGVIVTMANGIYLWSSGTFWGCIDKCWNVNSSHAYELK